MGIFFVIAILFVIFAYKVNQQNKADKKLKAVPVVKSDIKSREELLDLFLEKQKLEADMQAAKSRISAIDNELKKEIKTYAETKSTDKKPTESKTDSKVDKKAGGIQRPGALPDGNIGFRKPDEKQVHGNEKPNTKQPNKKNSRTNKQQR